MDHRAGVEHGLRGIEITIHKCLHDRRYRRRRMGDELGGAGGSGGCQQDRWRVLVGLRWHSSGSNAVDDQRRPRHGAFVDAARAGDEALLLCENFRLDGLDVGIKLLLAEIEGGLQAPEDLA